MQKLLLTYFEEFALRRIHCFNLATHDTKKCMVEKPCILVDEKPASCSDRPRAVLVGMVEAVGGKLRLIELAPTILLVF